MKRFFALLVAVVCVVGLAFPASAAVQRDDFMIHFSFCLKAAKQSTFWKDYAYKAVFYSEDGKCINVVCSTKSTIYVGDQIRVFSCNGMYVPTTWIYNSPVNYSGVFIWQNLIYLTSVSGGGLGLFVGNQSNCVLSGLSALDSKYTINITYADPSTLETLLAQAKSMVNIGYTSETWDQLQYQITLSQSLLDSGIYTQNQIFYQTSDLQLAINALFALPDTTDLETLLEDAEQIKDIGYTSTSWERLTTAIIGGRTLLSSMNFTHMQIIAATYELQSSISNLALIPVVTPPIEYPVPNYKDIGTGEVIGFLAPTKDIFFENALIVWPQLLGLLALVLSVRIVPKLLKRIVGDRW